MRIFIFKSETRAELHAFAGDLMGSRLPEQHGPWTATGAIGPDSTPPHHFKRDAIEKALDAFGIDAEVADSVARFRSHLDQAGAGGSRPNLDHDIIIEMPQLRCRDDLERIRGRIRIGNRPVR